MTDYRYIIAKNLTDLRVSAQYTQAEVASRLSYSDKAVSKWERAESIPDVAVLKAIADMYGVTVDYLLTEHDKSEIPEIKEKKPRRMTRNQALITLISLFGVWFIAVTAFAACYTYGIVAWQLFMWAVPISAIVALVLCCIWSGRIMCFSCISLLLLSLAAAIFITFIKYKIWLVFVAAAILEVTAVLAFGIRHSPQDKTSADIPDSGDSNGESAEL